MEQEKRPNPLIAEEDWWTVWFGLFILFAATILAAMTLSGNLDTKRVPKLGKWISNPADVFYRASTKKIDLDETTTFIGLADRINESQARRTPKSSPPRAEYSCELPPAAQETGRLFPWRPSWPKASPSSSSARESRTRADLGAGAYVSQALPSENTVVGQGRFSVTAQRVGTIGGSLVVSMLCVILLTAIGVRAMGQNPAGKYAVGFRCCRHHGRSFLCLCQPADRSIPWV